MFRTQLLALLWLSVGGAFVTAAPVTFEADVKPILRKHCLTCHNPERPRGDLDLSTSAAVLAGGTSGKAVISGKPDESLLYLVTAHLETPKMPPNKPKIPEKELATLRAWIEGGLLDKAGPTPTATVVEGLQPVQDLPRANTITALAVHPKGTLIAVPGHKQVLLYDRGQTKWLGGLAYPEGEVHALRFANDGKLLLVGGGVPGQSGNVMAFDTTTWKRVFTVGDETDAVLTCDLTPDNKHVVLGGPTRVVKIFSVADGKQVHVFRKPTDWVTTTRFSPDGLLVAAGDRFGTLFVWETTSGKEYAILRGHTKAITSIAWQPDGNALATTSEDGTVRLWNAHTLAEEKQWPAHEGGALEVQFDSPEQLTSVGRDQWVRVWRTNGTRVASFGPAADHLLKVARLDANTVLTGDWSGRVQTWTHDAKPPQAIVRPVRLPQTVATVLPPSPPKLVAPTLPPEPSKTLTASDLQRTQRQLTRHAAEAALQQLRTAYALAPDNAALGKAVAAAEAALQSLPKENR